MLIYYYSEIIIECNNDKYVQNWSSEGNNYIFGTVSCTN